MTTHHRSTLTTSKALFASGLIGIGLWSIVSHGCSVEERKPRSIRAHTELYEGVSHGFAAAKAERLCIECHGEQLQGGDEGEPSCFKCHGVNWDDRDPTVSLAPADHTTINGIFHHRPGLTEPLTNCSSCHGSELEGDESRVTPSCYLCHGQRW